MRLLAVTVKVKIMMKLRRTRRLIQRRKGGSRPCFRGSPSFRLIDGILLTKFDTIDDKVGAALSMLYISGSPMMFVGCGQSYTDLKKLNVKSIVKTLLK
ncbi:uncharacterized protein [Rutidosis leptorrhynchoides]|uniref:uncharacterized protein n=1 Tax=Rutidosis leptorrhynchoides TaxID=125765 RepID=UPI003A9993C0